MAPWPGGLGSVGGFNELLFMGEAWRIQGESISQRPLVVRNRLCPFVILHSLNSCFVKDLLVARSQLFNPNWPLDRHSFIRSLEQQQPPSKTGDSITGPLIIIIVPENHDGFQLGDKNAPLSIESEASSQNRKRFPETLHFNPSTFRLRSRTESTRSSISSAHIPDSATTYSVSTLASPLSSSYASDLQERFAGHCIDSSRPSSRIRHRHQPSSATTCSTYINDDSEVPIVVGYPDVRAKLKCFHDDSDELGSALETPSVHPLEDPFIKSEEDVAIEDAPEWPQTQTQCGSPVQSDVASVVSDDFSPEDVDAVLDFALQSVYGIELRETSAPTAVIRQLASDFLTDLGQHIWQTPSDTRAANTMSTASSSTTPSQGTGGESSQIKRKKLAGGEDGGEEYSDGEGSGFGPSKRLRPSPREEENLRLSCPFRKRNPHRFNVRDHHSCAMTYFPKFAELRQHIVKQHKRDDPSAFVCDRCTRDFQTRKDLRDHQRQPKEQMCDISDHDPESGIDGPTSIKLVSRKRASGTSADVQWREIWNILFPDDDDGMIRPYHFTPVIEHFELSAQYLTSFEFLQTSLRNKISNPATLETLATKFHQCFIEAVEGCATAARSMPYTNRSNKRNEPNRQSTVSRKPRAISSRPDSGVIMDDGSEESGSVLGSSGLGHRDSVRTVRSLAPRRGSNLAPKGLREVLPAPTPPAVTTSSTPYPALPLEATTSGIDPAAVVQAWNNGVTFDHEDPTFSMPEQWMMPPASVAGTMNPQADFATMDESFLYQTDFGTMGHGFTGFNGR
ncbi:zinc finger domain-containing protein [Purpureocillium lavendulum]|uniref:Zinc finger domain-containing protein n=1 Tax=Purpureocillium lavendulum TaxID=1247861 RepID=A0AB34FK60_9HYPO|nr:zinc finger domain-containing protein [Purpureocillium lavendulum]